MISSQISFSEGPADYKEHNYRLHWDEDSPTQSVSHLVKSSNCGDQRPDGPLCPSLLLSLCELSIKTKAIVIDSMVGGCLWSFMSNNDPVRKTLRVLTRHFSYCCCKLFRKGANILLQTVSLHHLSNICMWGLSWIWNVFSVLWHLRHST